MYGEWNATNFVGNGGDRGACRTLAQTRLFAYHPRSGLNFDFEKEPKWELYLNERRTTTRELQKKNDADYESPCNQLAEGHSNFFSRRRYPPRARCSVRFQKWPVDGIEGIRGKRRSRIFRGWMAQRQGPNQGPLELVRYRGRTDRRVNYVEPARLFLLCSSHLTSGVDTVFDQKNI